MISGQSIRRFVEPDEIADLCLFLASPAARMVTGQAIASMATPKPITWDLSAPWTSPSPKNSG